MKKLLSLAVLLALPFLSTNAKAQYADYENYNGAFVFQLGGQFLYCMQYEYAFVRKEQFTLAANAGFGRNEYGDDVTLEKPIRGIDAGLTTLSGKGRLFFEAGLHPATYFFGHNTFVNLNGWFGPRFFPRKVPECGLTLAYTPRLYTSFSDPTNHFVNALLGFKVTVAF